MTSSDNIEVLILCGGKGTRLASVIKEIPKPMAPIGDFPLLYYIIQNFKKNGFKNFCLLTGYKSEVIKDYFKNGEDLDINIRYSHEEDPLGTGGAIKQAISSSNHHSFLALNGDTYFDFDIASFLKLCPPQMTSLALKFIKSSKRYGLVLFEKNGLIKSFQEKQETESDGYINGGLYYLHKKILPSIGNGLVSFESEVFPKLIEASSLYGIPCEGQFLDIGIPEDYEKGIREIPIWYRRK